MPSDPPVQHPGPAGGTGEPTVLGSSPADRLALLIGGPLVGLVVGLVLPPASRWIGKGSLPMLGVFRLIASLPALWVILACVGLGLLAGLAMSASTLTATTVTVAGDRIELKRDGRVRTVPRSEVATVFRDGTWLTVLDAESRQIVREAPQVKPDRLAQAFRDHGYPWASADPYGPLYRKWEPDAPDVPATVGALLAARDTELRNKSTKDATRLLEELEELGYTVREEDGHQFWRPLVRS